METQAQTPSVASVPSALEAFLDDVDQRIKTFNQKASATAEAAATEAQYRAQLGLLEIEDLWTRGKNEILKVVTRLHDLQARPRAALEEGKIELYFGKEDAKEALGKLKERVEATQAQLLALGAEANEDAKAAVQRLSDAYAAIKDKLLH
jgi:hypothetical protein